MFRGVCLTIGGLFLAVGILLFVVACLGAAFASVDRIAKMGLTLAAIGVAILVAALVPA